MSSIHDDENSESVDLSQTFDGVLDLNSPGVTSSTEAKIDFKSESEKSPPLRWLDYNHLYQSIHFVIQYIHHIYYEVTYIHLFMHSYVM